MSDKRMSQKITEEAFLSLLQGKTVENPGVGAPLERRTAARITHEFLKQELKETDEKDWSAALCLKDLYDCRTCVNHVAQVFCKGIMDSVTLEDGTVILGMEKILTQEEAEEIVRRVHEPKLRRSVEEKGTNLPAQAGRANTSLREPVWFRGRTTDACLQEQSQTTAGSEVPLVIDVRPVSDYEAGHLPGAISLPMARILERPEQVGPHKNQAIKLYCEQGYQSEIAANCLREAGYTQISTFLWPV